MGLAFLTPLFLAGLFAVAIPVVVHLIRRHRGTPVAFPSLMFLRRLPVRDVRRRQIRDWPLLLIRASAVALLALAFARPVLQFGEEAVAGDEDAFREVVVVLDRSWSMTRGDRWARAVSVADSVVTGLQSPDRASLVLFDRSGIVAVEPTLEMGRIHSVLDTTRAGWSGARFGAGLQAASTVLAASDRSRREVVFISDFQRSGWEQGPRDRLPPGVRFTPIDVGDEERRVLVVADVALEHDFPDGRHLVTPTVRILHRGSDVPTRGELVLEVDGAVVESRQIEISAESTSVEMQPFMLAGAEPTLAAVRLTPQEGERPEAFRFVLSPREVLAVLLMESGEAASFLRRALRPGGTPPIRLETRLGTQGLSAQDLEGTDLVILHDVPLPAGPAATALRDHVVSGGGLLVVAGPGSAPGGWASEWDGLLPGRPGETVTRDPARGGSLTGFLRDHPVFMSFEGSEGGSLGQPRFFRYRALSGGLLSGSGSEGEDEPTSILARFDDGSPALTERATGGGRTLLWTSSFDTEWTDLPLQPTFVPLVREIVRYAGARRESTPFVTVGQPLDPGYLLEAAGLFPSSTAGTGGGEDRSGILTGPGGRRIELRPSGGPVELREPGFYDIEGDEGGGGQGWSIAANPDLGELDPARVDPEELTLAVQGDGSASAEGRATPGETSLAEGERRQGAWRFLLLAVLVLLLGEALLANRKKPLAKQVGSA